MEEFPSLTEGISHAWEMSHIKIRGCLGEYPNLTGGNLYAWEMSRAFEHAWGSFPVLRNGVCMHGRCLERLSMHCGVSLFYGWDLIWLQILSTVGGNYFVGVNYGAIAKYPSSCTRQQWNNAVSVLKVAPSIRPHCCHTQRSGKSVAETHVGG